MYTFAPRCLLNSITHTLRAQPTAISSPASGQACKAGSAQAAASKSCGGAEAAAQACASSKAPRPVGTYGLKTSYGK
jgi:hypothetical protein